MPLFLRICVLSVCLLLCACRKPPEVRAVKAVYTSVESTVTSVNSGSVKSEKLAELAFGQVGRVKKLNVVLGSVVKGGTVLAELENDDLATAARNAEAELARQENVFRSGGVSKSVLDQARNAVDYTRTALEKSTIRAPFDGQIVELNLEVGQLSQITAINPKPMMRIVDLEPRYVRAEVDEVDLPKIKLGLDARVKILAVRREPFTARVRKVIPFVSSVREQDRTSEVELAIDSEGILLPVGASADVEIVVEHKDTALAVPARAVLGRGGNRHVFGYVNGRVKTTPVQLGIFNYDRAEISSGIQEGDEVLLPAESAELTDGMTVTVQSQPWP